MENPTWLRSALTYGFYPAVLLGALLGYRALSPLGASDNLAVGVVVVVAGLVILVAEQWNPRSRAWTPTGAEWWRDLAASVLWHSLLPALVQALFAGLAAAAGARVAAALGFSSPWPSSLWLPLQVFVALAAAELGPYWVHRCFHTTEWGWSVHAVHHSTGRMHFLAAGRNHPLNVAVIVLLKLCTLSLLQVPAEVIALAAVFNGVNGLLQHSNVDQRTPLIDWLISTPDLHVWHHSKQPQHANSNYGTNVIVWDVLFGTRHKPRPVPSTQVGLDYPFPQTLLGQLLVPFTWHRISPLMHARHGTRATPPPWWLPLARYGLSARRPAGPARR